MSDSKGPRPRTLAYYTGDGVNYWPDQATMAVPQAFEAVVVQGWEPPAPFITPETQVSTFGSCFALRITEHLIQKGYKANKASSDQDAQFVFMSNWGAGLNNTFTLEQQFRYAFTDWVPAPTQWLDRDGNPVDGARWKTELTAFFHKTEVFILTLGLAEIWRDTVTGEAMWGTTLQKDYEAGRHVFGVTSVEDNYRNLQSIVRMVKEHRPGAKIIFTLSPVPLLATFRKVSCVTANEVSKSILRVAVDMLMRDEHPDVFYFPGYEMVRVLSKDPYHPDGRHVAPRFVGPLVNSFLDIYGVGVRPDVPPPMFVGCTDPSSTRAFAASLAQATGRNAVELRDPDFGITCEQILNHASAPTIFHGPHLPLQSIRLWQVFPKSRMVWVTSDDATLAPPEGWERALYWAQEHLLKEPSPYSKAANRATRRTTQVNPDRSLVLQSLDLARAQAFLRGTP